MGVFEVLLSFLGGGGMAIITEVLKYMDRKNLREHELSMAESGRQTAAEEAMGKASVAASTPMEYPKTGYPILDAGLAFFVVLNASVRPIITYWWVMVMYSLYKVALYFSMEGIWSDKIVTLWTTTDAAILVSIISFWFVARELRKRI